MSPKKKDYKMPTEVLTIKISKEMVEAFIDTCDEKKIWFEGLKLKGWRKTQAENAKELLKKIHKEDKKRKKPKVKFEIILSCSCYPKLGDPI